jgi:hypothetical protein
MSEDIVNIKFEAEIQWDGEKVTAEEYIMRLIDLIVEPVENMVEYEGDMWLSDYRKLLDAAWKLKAFETRMSWKNGKQYNKKDYLDGKEE